jgi:sulfotransferase family protein
MKVIGVGLGRTGTNSLKAAIEFLGYAPCYHMFDIVEQPSRIRHWQAAEAGTADWDETFEGYQSVVDFPAAVFWREITSHFPAAKVVLTVRSPQAWYDSARKTIFRKAATTEGKPLQARSGVKLLNRLSPDFGAFTGMITATVVERMFDGRVGDRDHAIKVFSRHIEEVTGTIGPGRLLVYDVADGWGPLCEFLGEPVPAGREFPRGNDPASFRREEDKRMRRLIVRSMMRASRATG